MVDPDDPGVHVWDGHDVGFGNPNHFTGLMLNNHLLRAVAALFPGLFEPQVVLAQRLILKRCLELGAVSQLNVLVARIEPITKDEECNHGCQQ